MRMCHLLCIPALLAALAWAAWSDHQAQALEDDVYCEMIELWSISGGHAGWPPYRGREVCDGD